MHIIDPVETEGTITAGGVSQQVYPARQRRYLRVVSRSPLPLYVRLGQAAVVGKGYWLLTQGQDIIWDNAVPACAVYIIGDTTGQPFTAEEAVM